MSPVYEGLAKGAPPNLTHPSDEYKVGHHKPPLFLIVLYIFKNKLTRYQLFANIAVLAAVIITIFLSKGFNYQGPIVGEIPEGLPEFSFKLFNLSPELVIMFIIHTVIISFVG